MQCIITGFQTESLKVETDEDGNLFSYIIALGNKTYFFRFRGLVNEWQNDNFIEKNRHIFLGLFLNDKWIISPYTIITHEILENLITSADCPKTPNERMENLLVFISNMQEYDGDDRIVGNDIINDCFKLYFREAGECEFYLKSLESAGLIESNHEINAGIVFNISLTYKGLQYVADLEVSGKHSNNCFIAMSFDEGDEEIFTNGILPALVETGFDALKVNEQHPESDQTINDRIVADIKRSRFCIADFTKHKKGVYFEAGYSAGRGIKVIYTCKESDFDDSHFDINHYPHIIYETPAELKEKLINKIEAWIKD